MVKTLHDYRFTDINCLSDLVNGVHMVITFKPKVFSWGDAYEVLPKIIENLYFACCKNKSTIALWTEPPSAKDLQFTFIQDNLLVVASIAPHVKTPDKVHCHLWVYGLHNTKMKFKEWWNAFNWNMRLEKYISSGGSPIFVEPVTDEIDNFYQDNTTEMSSYEPLAKYISSKKRNLLGYFRQKNNPCFLYHYSK